MSAHDGDRVEGCILLVLLGILAFALLGMVVGLVMLWVEALT